MNVRVKKEQYVTLTALSSYLKLQDLCFLLALHEMGFGLKRLREVIKRGRDIYKEHRDRYCLDSDVKNLTENSPHILALEEELKNGTGYDYTEEDRNFDESKYRYHGNQASVS